MIKLLQFAVGRPVTTYILFIVMILLGGYLMFTLPTDYFPDVSFPAITIITPYPGAGPYDVEKLVTVPIEDAVSIVQGVKDINSNSVENFSTVTVMFDWGSDLAEAANDVRAAIDLTRDEMPEEVTSPIIFKFDASLMPIMVLGARTERKDIDLRKIIENEYADLIKRNEGVGNIWVFGGGNVEQINILVDKTKLDSYGISITDIPNFIAGANVTLPAGEVEYSGKRYLVRFPGEISDVKEIEGIPIGFVGRKAVRLRDVAVIDDSYAEKTNIVKLDDQDGVIFAVNKSSGANTVDVANSVRESLEELREKYPYIDVQVFNDTSEYIVKSINNLAQTVIFAALLVILIGLLLLGRFASGLIIGFTIPVSLIVAFIFLYFKGATINLISLSSLAIAVGMVVDNAIVVLENIFFHRKEGEPVKQSAIYGAQEVGQAILASTLTTAVIFIPLIAVKGLVGVFFNELAWVVPIVLFTSLFASLTLTPTLSTHILRVKSKSGTKLERFINSGFSKLSNVYRSVIIFALRYKAVIIVLALFILIGGSALFTLIDTEFMPQEDQNFIRGSLEMPIGTPLSVTDSVANVVKNEMEEKNLLPELQRMGMSVGGGESGFNAAFGSVEGSHTANFFIALVDVEDRERTVFEIASKLNEHFADRPGISKLTFSATEGGGPFGSESAVAIELYGDNIPQTDSIALRLSDMLERIPGSERVVISRQSESAEIQFVPDREKLRHYGMLSGQLAGLLRASFYGATATTIKRDGEDVDIFVRFDSTFYKDPNMLENLKVTLPTGATTYLTDLGDIKIQASPLSIGRKNKVRMVEIGSGLFGRPLGAFIEEVEDSLADMQFPDGVSYAIGGQAKDQAETFGYLFWIFIAGAFLVYCVMAAQFENLLAPFIIILSIPFIVPGVALSLFIVGTPFGLMAFVGLVMLVGIVVNNGIVLVDFMNILRARGYSRDDAVIEGTSRRLRPILMTTFTTAGGLLPLALAKGQGSSMWNGFAIAGIGGLLFASLITLILIPTVYSIFIRKRKP